MNNGYSVLAEYYDKFTEQDCDYLGWSQYLCSVAQKYKVRSVADIACGTGKMTELLVKSGYEVVGIDASQQMLSEAVGKCGATFVRQDMRKLQLLRKADMAVCVNDGVNYLKPSELSGFFKRVADNLNLGAPFVFDLSSPYKLRNVVSNNVFYLDSLNETLLWVNKLYGDRVEMDLTLFVKRGELYERKEERHVQYIHEDSSVRASLEEAGFEVKRVTRDYGKKLSPKSSRITYYAVKRQSAQ
ncbi:MAG: methyltransferase domain-containing protein [Corallococcus sp.]|nr:methyltransferase domain-containing protein [Bacillota bacterium]MCM1533801.1 methyltransferase domain-containing protein [Corallococcus sp.]